MALKKFKNTSNSARRRGGQGPVNAEETVSMMRRVIEMKASATKPSHLELFKGTDLYRTLIVPGVYAAQTLTDNLIANQAVYFFEQAGLSSQSASSRLRCKSSLLSFLGF